MNRIDAHSEVTLKREETENREEKLCVKEKRRHLQFVSKNRSHLSCNAI